MHHMSLLDQKDIFCNVTEFPFQQSAGILGHLKGSVIGAIQQEPTPDLNPDALGALSALMLAQAQELFVQKAIHGEERHLKMASVLIGTCWFLLL